MEAMLYQIYDWQRAALEPWRVFARAANELYGHPDSPLSYLPGSRNVAAAFDLMTRLTQRLRAARRSASTRSRSARATTRCARCYDLEKPFCRLLHFAKEGAPRAAARAGVRAALGPLRDAAARHRARAARRPRRVDHRLDRREGDPDRRRAVPLRRLRGLRARVHRASSAAATCTPSRCASPRCRCWPAVSLMAAAGEAIPRTLTMMGGPIDTRRSPTDGQQLRRPPAALVVRGEGDPARADALSRASCAASTPASCSSPASSR